MIIGPGVTTSSVIDIVLRPVGVPKTRARDAIGDVGDVAPMSSQARDKGLPLAVVMTVTGCVGAALLIITVVGAASV
jgi:hypothetical protein